MDTEKLRRQLIDRITENYREYRANLLLKDRQELIDGAGRIADTALVFQHMADISYTGAPQNVVGRVFPARQTSGQRRF